MKRYSGKCSVKQLRQFLLLAMGVRFEEILKVQPLAIESLLYMPQARWSLYYHGKRWRAEFIGGGYLPWTSINIEGKLRGICGYSPEEISRIEKTSKSGNTLEVSSEYFPPNDDYAKFLVSVGQVEGKKKSNWFWMWKAVGVDLAADD